MRIKTHCRLKRRRKPHQWRKHETHPQGTPREGAPKGQALQVPRTPRNLRRLQPNP